MIRAEQRQDYRYFQAGGNWPIVIMVALSVVFIPPRRHA